MPLVNHPGLSEEDVEAAEVLGELRKRITNDSGKLFSPTVVTSTVGQDAQVSREGSNNLLNRVMNNVATFYDDRRKVASIARLLDDAYEDNYTTSEGESDSDMSDSEDVDDEPLPPTTTSEKRAYDQEKSEEDKDKTNDDDDDDDNDGSVTIHSKRQKISEAIDNFKEYRFNMSIESKRRLITCLHLLKLANKQLSEKVTNLQELVEKESEAAYQHHLKLASHGKNKTHKKSGIHVTSTLRNGEDTTIEEEGGGEVSQGEEEAEEEDEFFDAFDSKENDEEATIIKMEVVGTIKKVYSMISRFTGNSLPEPARSQVRASLLNLPTNWSSTVSHLSATSHTTNTQGYSGDNNNDNVAKIAHLPKDEETVISTNGKVLILAKESLDMVHNVMEVVDSTLGKAEEWVKQKQEIKEELYQNFRQTKINKDK